MGLGLFKTETLWVTEDNQAIQNNALDGQHSEKVFKPELCLLLIFLFYTLNRLRTTTTKKKKLKERESFAYMLIHMFSFLINVNFPRDILAL